MRQADSDRTWHTHECHCILGGRFIMYAIYVATCLSVYAQGRCGSSHQLACTAMPFSFLHVNWDLAVPTNISEQCPERLEAMH